MPAAGVRTGYDGVGVQAENGEVPAVPRDARGTFFRRDLGVELEAKSAQLFMSRRLDPARLGRGQDLPFAGHFRYLFEMVIIGAYRLAYAFEDGVAAKFHGGPPYFRDGPPRQYVLTVQRPKYQLMAETDTQERDALVQQAPHELKLPTQPVVILEDRVLRPREYYRPPRELAGVYFLSPFDFELRETC